MDRNRTTAMLGALLAATLCLPTATADPGADIAIVVNECKPETNETPEEEYCLIKGSSLATGQLADDILAGKPIGLALDEWEDKMRVCIRDYVGDYLLKATCPYGNNTA